MHHLIWNRQKGGHEKVQAVKGNVLQILVLLNHVRNMKHMNPHSYLPCALLIKSSELMHNKSQFLQMNSWLWQEHSSAWVFRCLKLAHTPRIYHVGVPVGCAGIWRSQQNDSSARSRLEKRVFSLFSHSVVAIQLENQEVLDWSADNMNFSKFTEAHRAKIRSCCKTSGQTISQLYLRSYASTMAKLMRH